MLQCLIAGFYIWLIHDPASVMITTLLYGYGWIYCYTDGPNDRRPELSYRNQPMFSSALLVDRPSIRSKAIRCARHLTHAFSAGRTQHQKLISYTTILVRAAPADDGHLNGRSCGRSVLRISALASVRIVRVARNPAYVYINILL